MALEIEVVSLILTLSAIVVTLQIIPKVHSEIVMGWRWVVLALVVFALKQVLNIYQRYEYGPPLELLFIVLLTIGLTIHLMKIVHNYGSVPQRRKV